MKKIRPLIISLAVTVAEFVAFIIWGRLMSPGDEMGFFLITTYLIFPLTTLILSAYVCRKNPIFLLVFVPIMFLAQIYMPHIVGAAVDFGISSLFTFVPAAIGTIIGIIAKKIVEKKKKT